MRVTILAASLVLWFTLPGMAGAAPCSGDTSLIKIPAGHFWMGSDQAERDLAYRIGSAAARKGRWFDAWELPRKQVYLPNYFIDKNLVTQSEYQRFVRETGHPAPFISSDDYQRQGYLVHPYKAVRRYLWRKDAGGKPAHPVGLGRHPVVLVSRFDGKSMCVWRGKKSSGRRHRLPTESEWEKAARGTQGGYFPWGNQFDPSRLNHAYRNKGTTSIGAFTKGASPYGVLDMAGNVFEWTSSDLGRGQAVMKGGGSWDDQPGITRAAARHGRSPRARHLLFGFRCVCEEK